MIALQAVKTAGGGGRAVLAQDGLTLEGGEKAAERNNCPRRYYLANAPEYTPRPGQMVEASMSVAPAGAKLFALQYIGSVEVLEPESLRQEIAQELEAALNTYRS